MSRLLVLVFALFAASGWGATASITDLRLETFTESFELVARLRPEALVVEIGRYASNEPVTQANVEVESGPAKAKAQFDAATGTYRVSDPALLQSLRAPGTHVLVFTVSAGSDTDLLEGKLRVGEPSADKVQGLPPAAWPMAASLAFVAGVALFGRRRKARRA